MRKSLKDKELLVLEATLDLFTDGGFNSTPISKIAKIAGISPGTIYLYFKNKQDMLDRLYLFIKKEMCQYAFCDYEEDANVETAFKKIWYGISNYKLTHRKEAMFLANCDISPVVSNEIKEEAIKHLQPFIEVCKRGQQEGVIRECDLHIIYAFSVNPMSFITYAESQSVFELNKDSLDTIYKMVWAAISINPNK